MTRTSFAEALPAWYSLTRATVSHPKRGPAMPNLDFKGKWNVYAHHMGVPYRPLVTDAARSLDPADADDNLIVHGDNLEALKALLPRYAGRVKCVYIDPPYNTGNEGWAYNDKVNSPLMQAWLAQTVDSEDLERHDKWLCMMWPRLQLLHELLADDGVIFVSIDDNEQHHLRMLMDEIFGEQNFVNCFAWVGNLKGRQIGEYGAAKTYEQVLAYARDRDWVERWQVDVEMATGLMPSAYRNADYDVFTDDRGEYVIKNELHNTNSKFNEETASSMVFNIHYNPTTDEFRFSDVDSNERHEGFSLIQPKSNNDGMHLYHAWRWSRDKIAQDAHDLHIENHNGIYRIWTKVRSFDTTTMKDLITDISSSNNLLRELGLSFPTPKPLNLLKVLVGSVTCDDDIILDSFAGSGTTAHAVLALNKEDSGNRRFILVECEEYADSITAERVRRVIRGVPGAKNAALRGGLGGSFTYCTLGEPIEPEGMLTGDALPTYGSLAAYLLFTATGVSAGEGALQELNEDGLFQETEEANYYLVYRPDTEWLRSNEAVLTEERAERIGERNHAEGKRAVVFATEKYMGQRDLTDHGIIFCRLPYELPVRR